MKPLPPLSLDLRNETLARQPWPSVDVIYPDKTVVGRISMLNQSYDHAGEIVDRCNAYPTAIKALRALAIVPTMKPGVREVVHDGHRCRVCASTWDEPEKHQDWCALKGSER